MKTAGTVYKKLREIKFRHLVVLYKKYLKKSPGNCKYNYVYKFIGADREVYPIRLCLVHQESAAGEKFPDKLTPHLVDVCQYLGDCQTCNAFAPRLTREEIKAEFEKELSIKKVREAKYPDICALEWVLERSSVGMLPLSRFQSLLEQLKKILGVKKDLPHECDKDRALQQSCEAS